MELWRRAVRVATWRSRDAEEEAQRYRASGDALQACGRGDVEVWRSGALELWRHAAGVASKEVWSSSVLFVVVA